MKILNLTFQLTIILASTLLGAEEIDFESRNYKVVHASGSFDTFGHIAQGDVLEFNPRKLMTSKPGFLNFKQPVETKDKLGNSYLSLVEGNFQLTETLTNKYEKSKSYSFVSKGDRNKTRFDVFFDQNMIITYEHEGIIVGVVVLNIEIQEAEQGGAGQPAVAPESKPKGKEKPELESVPPPQ